MFNQYILLALLSPLLALEDDCVTVEAEGPGQWQGLVQLGPFQGDSYSNIIIIITITIILVITIVMSMLELSPSRRMSPSGTS